MIAQDLGWSSANHPQDSRQETLLRADEVWAREPLS